MRSAQDNKRKEIREQVSYYIDDSNIPDGRTEKIAYLGCSRRYLARLVLDGYRFLKANNIEDQYLEWVLADLPAPLKPLK